MTMWKKHPHSKMTQTYASSTNICLTSKFHFGISHETWWPWSYIAKSLSGMIDALVDASSQGSGWFTAQNACGLPTWKRKASDVTALGDFHPVKVQRVRFKQCVCWITSSTKTRIADVVDQKCSRTLNEVYSLRFVLSFIAVSWEGFFFCLSFLTSWSQNALTFDLLLNFM